MKLYMAYMRVYFYSVMQHKMSLTLTIIGQFLTSFFAFLGLTFLFGRFNQVLDFTYGEVLLCFATVLMAYSLAEFFARGFDTFDNMLANGQFDRIMVRPRNEIFQILSSTFELSRVGRFAQAVIIYLYAIPNSGVVWGMDKIAVQLLMIVCGTLFFATLFLLYAAICFFTTQGLEVFNILTDGSREFGRYPLSIYGKRILTFFTYIIPLACIQYFPLLYLTDKSTSVHHALSPLYATLLIVPVLWLWRLGIRHYKSTGS